MGRLWLLWIVLTALVLTQGCAPGYNSVLFATKSNLGFDADTTPPNLEVGISRQEGVLEPTFESGQTLPVMASFSSASNTFANFFWGVNSTFATGEAAYIMTYLYNENTKNMDTEYERVTLSQVPDPKLPFGCKVHYITPGEAKPVTFATDTVLGVKIRWSGQTTQYPSSINIGFKRKEGAWAPIAIGANRITDPENPNNVKNKPYEADIASLLATIDTGVNAAGTGAGLTYIQYFATGSAASNLARRVQVREAMLKRAGFDVRKFEEGKGQRAANWNVIKQIAALYRAAEDSKKAEIITEANVLGLTGANVTKENFIKALGEHSDAPPETTKKLEDLLKFASS